MFATNTVQYFGGQIKSSRRGWLRASENLCHLLCNALPGAGQGVLESSYFHFSSVFLPSTSCSFPSFAIYETSTNGLQKGLCDMPKNQHTKSGTLKCKTLVLVDSNTSHPHQTGELMEREGLAVVRTDP